MKRYLISFSFCDETKVAYVHSVSSHKVCYLKISDIGFRIRWYWNLIEWSLKSFSSVVVEREKRRSFGSSILAVEFNSVQLSARPRGPSRPLLLICLKNLFPIERKTQHTKKKMAVIYIFSLSIISFLFLKKIAPGYSISPHRNRHKEPKKKLVYICKSLKSKKKDDRNRLTWDPRHLGESLLHASHKRGIDTIV